MGVGFAFVLIPCLPDMQSCTEIVSGEDLPENKVNDITSPIPLISSSFFLLPFFYLLQLLLPLSFFCSTSYLRLYSVGCALTVALAGCCLRIISGYFCIERRCRRACWRGTLCKGKSKDIASRYYYYYYYSLPTTPPLPSTRHSLLPIAQGTHCCLSPCTVSRILCSSHSSSLTYSTGFITRPSSPFLPLSLLDSRPCVQFFVVKMLIVERCGFENI